MAHDYDLLIKQAEALLSVETDAVANAANLCAMLYHQLEGVNWVGFYFLKQEELVLGPFSGQPACTRIALGKGVCGTAFVEKQTKVVDDVHNFAGHIACDAASNSEIVVPFFTEKLSGVFDIDSPELARFSDLEKVFFERILALYLESLN